MAQWDTPPTDELMPIRPEHPDGIAAILNEPGHINYPNSRSRVGAIEDGLSTLVLFLTMANADIPPPPAGHVRAADFSEPPVPADVLMARGEQARLLNSGADERRWTEEALEAATAGMKIPGLRRSGI